MSIAMTSFPKGSSRLPDRGKKPVPYIILIIFDIEVLDELIIFLEPENMYIVGIK